MSAAQFTPDEKDVLLEEIWADAWFWAEYWATRPCRDYDDHRRNEQAAFTAAQTLHFHPSYLGADAPYNARFPAVENKAAERACRRREEKASAKLIRTYQEKWAVEDQTKGKRAPGGSR